MKTQNTTFFRHCTTITFYSNMKMRLISDNTDNEIRVFVLDSFGVHEHRSECEKVPSNDD